MIGIKDRIQKNIHIDSKVMQVILDFTVGFILTRSVIIFSVLPFGIAFSLAKMQKNDKVYAMLGAFTGYLLLENTSYGFRYAGVLLIISALLHLTRINVYALISMIMPIFFLIDTLNNGFLYTSLVLMLSEVMACNCATFLYAKLFENDENYQKPCLLFLASTIISSLTGITIFLHIAPIRVFAVLIILLVTYFGKSGMGCVASVILGIAMDSSLGVNSAIFTLSYGFSSVISSSLANMNKMIFCAVFLSMYGISAIFAAGSALFLASVCEVFLATLLFILIPNNKFSFIKNILNDTKVQHSISSDKIFDFTSNASSILNQMSKVLGQNIEKVDALSYDDINKVYLATTEKVCKNCELAFKCWNKDYISSIDSLNSANSKAVLRGYFKSTDFPIEFSTRCINFVDFLNGVNEGVISINQKNQINETLQANKQAISSQCTAISSILKDITYAVSDSVETFPELESEIQEKLHKYTLGINVSCYNNSADRLYVEVFGSNTFELIRNSKEVCRDISYAVSRRMEFMSQIMENGASKLIFCEKNKYKLEISSKIISKQRISGDVVDIFENDAGVNFVILSDGMGSGACANDESIQVIDLLSKMLKSGISLPKALKGVSPLVCIKNNDKNFVALDVISVDLSSLEGVLAKYGAAPTYILRGSSVHKITSTNMPLGLSYKAEISRVKLTYNDMILMMSDGILSTEDDDHIVKILKNSANKTCEQISNEILSESSQDDDKTIIVIKVGLNK
ncbi:MAG: SpoIIE family protein phosphatase [Clostridia bacterium]